MAANELAYFPSSTRQSLSYREQSLLFTLNQLVGKRWALGALYRVTESELRTTMHDLAAFGAANGVLTDRATLHELGLSANYTSPCGDFARAEANFFAQSLRDDPNGLPAGTAPRGGDSFWQFNAFAGYRFHRNLCEVSDGVLNLADQNYQLSPLNPWSDIARERTFVLRFRLCF